MKTNLVIPETPNGGSMQPVVGRPYRITEWLNTKTLTPVYGIQHKRANGKYANCACDGTPLLYDDLEIAKRHCRWLNDPKGTEPEWTKDVISDVSPNEKGQR